MRDFHEFLEEGGEHELGKLFARPEAAKQSDKMIDQMDLSDRLFSEMTPEEAVTKAWLLEFIAKDADQELLDSLGRLSKADKERVRAQLVTSRVQFIGMIATGLGWNGDLEFWGQMISEINEAAQAANDGEGPTGLPN